MFHTCKHSDFLGPLPFAHSSIFPTKYSIASSLTKYSSPFSFFFISKKISQHIKPNTLKSIVACHFSDLEMLGDHALPPLCHSKTPSRPLKETCFQKPPFPIPFSSQALEMQISVCPRKATSFECFVKNGSLHMTFPPPPRLLSLSFVSSNSSAPWYVSKFHCFSKN